MIGIPQKVDILQDLRGIHFELLFECKFAIHINGEKAHQHLRFGVDDVIGVIA